MLNHDLEQTDLRVFAASDLSPLFIRFFIPQ